MTRAARSVRLGDPMAPIIAWGAVLFLALIALVVVFAGVNLAIAAAGGQSVPGAAVGVLVLFVGLLAGGGFLILRIWSRVHRIAIGPDGTWTFFNSLGVRRAALEPGASRVIRLTSYTQLVWQAQASAMVRQRAELRVHTDDGRRFVGHTNEGPALLGHLGYEWDDAVMQATDTQVDVSAHTFEGGGPRWLDG